MGHMFWTFDCQESVWVWFTQYTATELARVRYSGGTRGHVEQGSSKAARDYILFMEVVELIITTGQGFITQGNDRS